MRKRFSRKKRIRNKQLKLLKKNKIFDEMEYELFQRINDVADITLHQALEGEEINFDEIMRLAKKIEID